MTRTLDPAAQAFLQFLESDQKSRPPLPEDPVAQVQARRLGYRGMIAMAGTPEPVAEIRDLEIPTNARPLRARLYRPACADKAAALYVHGGGFVIGDLDTHDAPVRTMANRSLRTFLSLEYRLAPEHPYPAALEDGLAGLDWLVANAASLDVDPKRIAVIGDSAGGELSCAISIANRDRAGPAIERQILIYPMADMSAGRAARWSSIREQEGKILTERDMDTWIGMYVGSADPMLPTLSPARAKDLSRLPPSIVITAGFDPLRDEGEALARGLKSAGVEVEHWRYESQIHGFMQMGAFVPEGRALLDRLGDALRT